MSPLLLFSFVVAYFVLLLVVAYRTSRGSNNESFFIGNRNSNWMLVAFGMIGTSLSGVTFVSVPGAVARDSFSYFQITLGYFLGYILIAYVLLPLYYRLHLTSIYNYLNERLGISSYKTGAAFFILSRVLGATARLYLVVNILQDAILSGFHVPFWLTTLIILLMILLYTYEGGVKTIVWTDTLQTTCMLGGMLICVIYILHHLNLNLSGALQAMDAKGYSKIFFTDPGQQIVLPETNHCGNIYNCNHDGHGPGNDAEKYFCKNIKGLAEKYGCAGIHHAGRHFSFPVSRRTLTLVRCS